MNFPHQEIEAKAFLDANAAQIDSVMSDLKDLSKAYLAKFGGRVFDRVNLATLEQALEIDVILFGIELRRLADARKEGFGAESVYWDVVDGIYSLIDALGAQFRYTTQALRKARVERAIEYVRLIRQAV